MDERFAKHIKELEEFGLLPENWFWHQDKVRELKKIVSDLIESCRKGEIPKIFENLEHLSQQLNKIEAMLKQKPSAEVQKREAEIVNKLTGQIKKLVAIFPSAEQKRSREVAEQKLEKIMRDDFFDYGVRFVNKEEFFKIMKTSRLETGREIYVMNVWGDKLETEYVNGKIVESLKTGFISDFFKTSKKPFYFKDYLAWNISPRYHPYDLSWRELAERMTQWDVSVASISINYEIFFDLRKAMHQAKKEGLSGKEARNKALSIFRQEYKEYERRLKEGDKLGEMAKLFGKTNLNRLREIILTDEHWLEKKGNLELFINFLTCVGPMYGFAFPEEQYHIAMIFEGPFKEASFKASRNWFLIGEPSIGKRLLAAIAIIMDRKLLKKMVELSSKAGDFSCPIFSSRGTVLYPRR